MALSKTSPTLTTPLLMPLLSTLLASSLLLVLFSNKDKLAAPMMMWPLLWALVALTSLTIVAAARATMVTWITVLVLLAFAGNRRRVLVKRGRTITNDVAMLVVGVLAVICATVFSLVMAFVGIKEALISL